MNKRLIVKKLVSETEFIVYHVELRTDLVLKQILFDEDLSSWIQLPAHTNIITAFDTFKHIDGDRHYHFSLCEATPHGTMYKYI